MSFFKRAEPKANKPSASARSASRSSANARAAPYRQQSARSASRPGGSAPYQPKWPGRKPGWYYPGYPEWLVELRLENLGNLRRLIDQGADVNTWVFNNAPALLWAVTLGHINTDIIEMLVNAGADVNATDKVRGLTALHYCAKFSKLNIMKMLIDAGADVNKKTKQNFLLSGFKERLPKRFYGDENITPLHQACQYGNDLAVQMLINAGADVNAKSMANETPLHLALLNLNKSREKIIQLLIHAGADINAADYNGMTPLELAKTKGLSLE